MKSAQSHESQAQTAAEILDWGFSIFESAADREGAGVSPAAREAFYETWGVAARFMGRRDRFEADRSKMAYALRYHARLAATFAELSADGEVQPIHLERSIEQVAFFKEFSTHLCDRVSTEIQSKSA